ncbi:DUF1080 domain-containing protein [uncultured Eudoraea sp.]|uniref:3-keto-disaccharide hydrolase n=1 Tax=uncultured Eudoraea sp. TaxID=1035614 RepID=UPI00262FFBE6|nr:DUF1080 domain-containing protein [uncultured Eudoraea sp.]
MKTKYLVLSCMLMTFACKQAEKKDPDWNYLFNGDNLEQWDTYLGPSFGPDVSWENIESQPAIGHNNDSLGVFSMVDLDGTSVMRISGQVWGGIFTKGEFENYHLQLQFKWGSKKWYPREEPSDKRDSGLLYHGIGTHGENDLFWLKSQEFQIQEGDCGDFWGVAGTIIDVRAHMGKDSTYYYDPNAELLTFSEHSENGRNCKKYPDAEKPSGEWNTIDLFCFEGTSVHMVNGTVTMILNNSRHNAGDGKEIPLTKGKIELQSESAEVFYKDIKIRPIKSLPNTIKE